MFVSATCLRCGVALTLLWQRNSSPDLTWHVKIDTNSSHTNFSETRIPASRGLRGAHSTWLHLFASLRLLYKYVNSNDWDENPFDESTTMQQLFKTLRTEASCKSPDLMWHVEIDTNLTRWTRITKWHIGRTRMRWQRISYKEVELVFQLRLATH